MTAEPEIPVLVRGGDRSQRRRAAGALSAAAGYEIWYWPEITAIHLGGESSKTVKRLTMSSAGSQLTLWRMRSALLYTASTTVPGYGAS